MGQKESAPLIAAIVVAIAVPVVVGAYFIIKGGEGGAGGGGGGVGPSGGVGSASSLDYNVDMTVEGQTITRRYRAKNIGSPNLKIRIDTSFAGEQAGGQVSYIMDFSENKAWMGSGGEWGEATWVDVQDYNTAFQGYTANLSGWTSGDYSYSYGGATIRIYDIVLNPSLSDNAMLW